MARQLLSERPNVRGATNRLSAVRWGIPGRIVWAWVITIPASALIAAITLSALQAVHPTGWGATRRRRGRRVISAAPVAL